MFWIQHRSTAELAGRFEEIAAATGLPRELLAQAQHRNADVTALVWDHLNRLSGWVVVLDNLDQPTNAAPASCCASIAGGFVPVPVACWW